MNPKLIIVGAAAVATGAFQYWTKKQRLASWRTTDATVENIRRDRRGDATVRVQYVDEKSVRHSVSLPVADGDTIGLGSTIRIAYNPVVPEEAFVSDKKDMNWTALLAVVGGTLLLVLGILDYRIPHE